MNKSDLITMIAKDASITNAQAAGVVETLMETIARALKKGERVSLVRFGTFSLGMRAGRIGRNPSTRTAIKIASRRIVKFRASMWLLGERQPGIAEPMMDDLGPSDDGGPSYDDGGPKGGPK